MESNEERFLEKGDFVIYHQQGKRRFCVIWVDYERSMYATDERPDSSKDLALLKVGYVNGIITIIPKKMLEKIELWKSLKK